MRTVIIQGSSRSHGNTRRITDQLMQEIPSDLIDLNQYNIGPYDYEYRNKGDDYLPLIRSMIKEYDLFLFNTPIYWYTMSGIMKNFIDRFSDLLRIEKDTGRKLRGKYMGTVCCGSEEEPTPCFFKPFRLTADYLGMDYIGELHTWVSGEMDEKVKKEIANYAEQIRKLGQ
jgi:multimeric flavodoxin WrbA